MKRSILVSLSIGIGWVLGITAMMILMPLSGMVNMTFSDAIGNLAFFSFPGFILFMVAIILAIKDNSNDASLYGNF